MHTVERHVKGLFIFMALLVGVGLADSRTQVLPKSNNGIIIFSGPVQFGQRFLPAGIYEFHCIHKGKNHLMAVYRVTLTPPRDRAAARKPVAIDYCRMEPLRHKVKVTSVVTMRDNAGNSVVKEVRIQDEQVRHVFGQVLVVDRSEYL